MEAGAANPRLPSQDRARYAELARGQRRIQAYQEEAAKLAEQGIEAPDWIAWHTHRIREEKAAETAEAPAERLVVTIREAPAPGRFVATVNDQTPLTMGAEGILGLLGGVTAAANALGAAPDAMQIDAAPAFWEAVRQIGRAMEREQAAAAS
jgi:hypothetical protein